MTPEQREAAITLMVAAHDKAVAADVTAQDEFDTTPDFMRATLDALLASPGFVVLSRDDVTEETREIRDGGEVMYRASGLHPTHSRLVTRWEPITEGPCATGEVTP